MQYQNVVTKELVELIESTEHPASSYGLPVLVDVETGAAVDQWRYVPYGNVCTLSVDVPPEIYDNVARIAKKKGIEVGDAVAAIVGDYLRLIGSAKR